MSVRARPAEVAAVLPGDDVVPDADVVLDTAFDLPGAPADAWPWFLQLGKRRAGWYLPRWVELVVPAGRRGLRHLDPALAGLRVEQVIPDWGGADATFTATLIDPPHTLVYRSTRARIRLSWAITLRPEGLGTRVQLRLRLAGVRRLWLARSGGGAADRLTVIGLAAGLRERV